MIDRINELKQTILRRRLDSAHSQPAFHWFYLEGFAQALDTPFEIREACARLHFYQNVPIEILPGEAIVGQIDWTEPFVCQVSNTHVRSEVLDRILQSDLPATEKETIQAWIESVRPFCFDPESHLSEEERLVNSSHLAPSTFFNGHIVPDYASVLTRGFGGLLADIHAYRSRPLSAVERNFYDAMEITIQGLSVYITRYADLADDLRQRSVPGYDPEQLIHISSACRSIAAGPAKNLPEALQLMWFVLCFVDYDSFGRFDQYILPFYEISRAAGLSDAEACLWMKYTWIKIEESGAILNMTIGGRNSDGNSAVNPLTYLAMQVTRELRHRSPNLSLRIRASDPEELWQAAHLTLSTGQGLPALYNEDLIVPMLVSLGYAQHEAYDFSLAGCSQVILPGRCNFACDVGCYNLLKALELALHDGYDPLLMKQVGPHTGKPNDVDSYARLKTAYDRQMRFMTRVGVAINDKDMFLRQKEGACVRSLLVADCLQRGRGIFHGGARFYNIQNEACGITNAANALFAIKRLVFEDPIVSLSRLVEILDANWVGQEKLRLAFKNRCAKFGNDQPDVDHIRASIAADWYAEIQQYPALLGGFHWPGEVVFIYHEQHGAHTAASADGRKCGEPLASSAGATSGTDTSGPTALMNSMLKIPQEQCRTCCVLNLRFSKKLWNEDSQSVTNLLRTYFSRGGYQMQINLVSRADLLAARKIPEQFADLVVRVGGFSDYYVRLPEQLQDEILLRTEHEI
jgi:pyruvate-formate lyase